MWWMRFLCFVSDIEYLLGRPLQQELAAETQIEVALDSFLDISSSKYCFLPHAVVMCSRKFDWRYAASLINMPGYFSSLFTFLFFMCEFIL